MQNQSRHNLLCLSVGELGFVLDALHMEDAALRMVQGQLDISTVEETQLIISASGHSLLARSLASIGADDCYEIEDSLVKAVRLFADSEWMIQCNRSIGDEITFISFHFSRDGILKHSPRDGVVHELEIMTGVAHAVEAVGGFYSAPKNILEPLTPVRLSQEVVDEIRDSTDYTHIENHLLRAHVIDATRHMLASDLTKSSLRGSIVRVDHYPNGSSIVEHRLFLLRGEARLWLLQPDISAAGNFIEFVQGTPRTLGDALARVIAEPAPKWSS